MASREVENGSAFHDRSISMELLDSLTPARLAEEIHFERFAEVARAFLPPERVAYLHDPPGREPYKLLAFLSTLAREGPTVDIGTLHGSSALALSYGSSHVVSYDVARLHRFPDHWRSVEFVLGNVLIPGPARDRFVELAARSRLVSLDVDPHDGEQERVFVALLGESRFRGCLVLDDIHLNPPMRRFWDAIELPKIDLTACGHTTGTGCVLFP
jgi:hypothetical protein